MGMKYLELRCMMLRRGIGRREIAKAIGHGDAYVTTRMHGHKSWTLEEIYAICKLLDIPHDQIPLYFPLGGVAKPEPWQKEAKRA